jgi:hypothetical protein
MGDFSMSAITKAIARLEKERNETWYFGVENPNQVVDQTTFTSNVMWGTKDPQTQSVSWNGTAKCTWADIQSYVNQAKQEEQDTAYRFLRSPEYPSMGDQLDALWKGGAAAEEMAAKIQAVKDKYPKP